MVDLLIKLYLPLIAWTGLGILLGRTLPAAVPLFVGKALFWLGVPLSIMVFLRQADLSGSVWIAPVACWGAIALSALCALLWLHRHPYSRATQGSFLLGAMIGNTGYLGYPVTLALVDPKFFGWAVFYDTLGSTLGAYGLGVLLAARFGGMAPKGRDLLNALVKNPALWSFWIGLSLRSVALPAPVEQGLRGVAWGVIILALLLIGMRLSQITTWRNLSQTSASLAIKMLIVPLMVGLVLKGWGVTGAPLLVLVLETAMPPAFATLVIAEAYNLDRDLAVTALALGSVGLLALLPLWLWLFGSGVG